MVSLTDVWAWYSSLEPVWLRIAIGVFAAVGVHMALKIPEWLWRKTGRAMAGSGKLFLRGCWKRRGKIARRVGYAGAASLLVYGVMSIPFSKIGEWRDRQEAANFEVGECVQVVSPLSVKQGEVGTVTDYDNDMRTVRLYGNDVIELHIRELKEISLEIAADVIAEQKTKKLAKKGGS